MGLYALNDKPIKKTSKLNYLSASVLRSVYLIKLNPIHHSSEKRIYSRGSCIPRVYKGFEIVIHRGRGFNIRYVNEWMFGFKFGEFT